MLRKAAVCEHFKTSSGETPCLPAEREREGETEKEIERGKGGKEKERPL